MSASGDSRLAFDLAEFQRRLRAVRDLAVKRGFDVLVLQGPEDIYYVSGFQTLGFFAYHALVVPVGSDPCLVVRYGDRAHVWARSWIQEMEAYRDTEDPIAVTGHVLERSRGGRVGVDTGSDKYLRPTFLTPSAFQRLVAGVPGATFEECPGVVERLRAIKSPAEIAYVEAAARVASSAVAAGLETVREGRTDRDIAAAVHSAMILAGGEYPPLPPLITVGAETTLSHNTWSGQTMRAGDVATLEVPGVVHRYLAAITRSAVVGEPPSYVPDRVKIVLEALDSGIGAMRPGVTCAEAYEAFVKPYQGQYDIPRRVGYSIGVNFPPRWPECPELDLLPNNRTVLEPGMVFHTPLDVRVYGEQRPMFSETVLITETGHRVLTEGPRVLIRR